VCTYISFSYLTLLFLFWRVGEGSIVCILVAYPEIQIFVGTELCIEDVYWNLLDIIFWCFPYLVFRVLVLLRGDAWDWCCLCWSVVYMSMRTSMVLLSAATVWVVCVIVLCGDYKWCRISNFGGQTVLHSFVCHVNVHTKSYGCG
jgi:hypothetical protein